MTATWLDFSRRRELTLHARVIADVQAVATALDVPVMITGAFARDLLIHYAHGINPTRQTEDVDFALAVADWPAFVNLKQRLVGTGRFRDVPGAQQRLRHVSDLPVDLVPFGGVETASRQVDWPPGGEFRMDVFGFREALASAWTVGLPKGVEASVVSLPALALLKLITWQDRHYRAPKKDALDLMLVVADYLDLGNQERLWNKFPTWTEADDFDTRRAGARMLGVDIADLLDDAGRDRVAVTLAEQSDTDTPGLLPQEMNPLDADLARSLLRSVLEGLFEK
jgi:predicted nucleotidyltransferase